MPKRDKNFMERFERGLNTGNLEKSKITAKVLGYGEISTTFQIGDDRQWAYKRMPLFTTVDGTREYADIYQQYCRHLTSAGINIPEDELQIVAQPGHPVVLYIVQHQFPAEWFAHHLIHQISDEQVAILFNRIVPHALQVWAFNRNMSPATEIALDAQLSNWVFEDGVVENGKIFYVDTSTPLFRLDGVEQLNPELILQSAPSFLRWIIRQFFLKGVMERYYDQCQVLIDLAANLYKEQRSDLIAVAVEAINIHMNSEIAPITEKDIDKYYREDKLIWILFLNFRRIDRWIKTSIFHKRYEFILPGKIKR